MELNSVQTIKAETTEQHLIQIATDAVSNSNWIIGHAAAEWTERYGAGRTDADFANLIGSSQPVVNVSRRVSTRFHSRRNKHTDLSWSQWRELVGIDNAEQMLDWRLHTEGTWQEMLAWGRADRGEPLIERNTATDTSIPFTGSAARETPPASKPIVKPGTRKQTKTQDSGDSYSGGDKQNTEPDEPRTPVMQIDVVTIDQMVSKKQFDGALEQWIKALEWIATAAPKRKRILTAEWLRLLADDLTKTSAKISKCPIDEIHAAVSSITGTTYQRTRKRDEAMRARWRDAWWREHWRDAVKRAGRSKFLMGNNDRNWVMHIEWFCRPDTVARILEGTYDNTDNGLSARVRGGQDFDSLPTRGFDE